MTKANKQETQVVPWEDAQFICTITSAASDSNICFQSPCEEYIIMAMHHWYQLSYAMDEKAEDNWQNAKLQGITDREQMHMHMYSCCIGLKTIANNSS